MVQALTAPPIANKCSHQGPEWETFSEKGQNGDDDDADDDDDDDDGDEDDDDDDDVDDARAEHKDDNWVRREGFLTIGSEQKDSLLLDPNRRILYY